jgi:hypothetical protein
LVQVLVETACDLLFLTPEERKRVGFVSSRGELVCATPRTPPATHAAAAAAAAAADKPLAVRADKQAQAVASAVEPPRKALSAAAFLPHVTKIAAMGAPQLPAEGAPPQVRAMPCHPQRQPQPPSHGCTRQR